jgi:beta-glucosidase
VIHAREVLGHGVGMRGLGRPLILGEVADLADAIVAVWLPGTEGQGVADVLFGDVPATGKLGHSWPRSMSQIPINVGDPNYEPLYAYMAMV